MVKTELKKLANEYKVNQIEKAISEQLKWQKNSDNKDKIDNALINLNFASDKVQVLNEKEPQITF